MTSVRRRALGAVIFVVVAPIFLALWLILLGGIGELSHSDFVGVCGPYGPMGNQLLIVLLIGVPVVLVGAGLVTRRILRRVHRNRPEREPAVSAHQSYRGK